jgi:hypothetical protein
VRQGLIGLDWPTEIPIQENSRPTLNRAGFLNAKDAKVMKKTNAIFQKTDALPPQGPEGARGCNWVQLGAIGRNSRASLRFVLG